MRFMPKYRFIAAALLCLCPLFAAAETFTYKHQTGDKYRILSTVDEEVYLDNRLSHRAEILNRITGEVIGESEGKGKHKAVFQTSERAETQAGRQVGAGMSYQWAREYESEFERDPLGRITIDKKY
jgi:hypothetical protein